MNNKRLHKYIIAGLIDEVLLHFTKESFKLNALLSNDGLSIAPKMW